MHCALISLLLHEPRDVLHGKGSRGTYKLHKSAGRRRVGLLAGSPIEAGPLDWGNIIGA